MIRIITAIALVAAYLFSAFTPAKADTSEADKQTATYLTMIADGRLQEVKAKLPDLMVERPNDPGVQLLLAVVIDDAFKALDIYKKITDTYPESEWADDAYWRVVQFYAVMGDTTKAQTELNNFRRRYPTSGYLVPAIDVVRSSIAMTRAQIKPVVEGPMMTPPVSYANRLEPLTPTRAEKAKTEKTPAPLPVESKPKQESNLLAERTAPEPVVTPPTESVASTDAGTKEEFALLEAGSEESGIETPAPEQTEEQAQEDDKPVLLASNTNTIPVEEKATIQREKSGYYGLQVASYSDRTNAEDAKAKFIGQRMRTEILQGNNGGAKVYAVVIGNYSSRSSAEAAKIIVGRQCECEPIIIEK